MAKCREIEDAQADMPECHSPPRLDPGTDIVRAAVPDRPVHRDNLPLQFV
jgi:hypothetical protein